MRAYWAVLVIWLILFGTAVSAEPGGVAGDRLWLRADMGIGGDPVYLWSDQSTSGHDANQSVTTYRPDYIDNRANHNPALYFTDHFLDIDYASDLNEENMTIFVVVKPDIDDSTYRSPWTSRNSPPSKGQMLYLRNSKYQYWSGRNKIGNKAWHQLKRVGSTKNYEIVTTSSQMQSANLFKKYLYLQGQKKKENQTTQFAPNTSRPFRIGKGATESATGNFPWHGDIAEVVVYNSKLNDNDRLRVESYLAMKYGITLDQSNGGQDYTESSGSVVWSASYNSGFGRDIAAIARDDGSSLHQRVSKSINEDAIITISTNSDFDSSNLNSTRVPISTDKSFLFWSNNKGAAKWKRTGAPANGKLLKRKWKVQKSGSSLNGVSLQIDVDDPDFDLEPFAGTLYFVKGDDLSMATPVAMINDGNGKWHIDGVNFKDGELFGFVINPSMLALKKSSIVLSDPANSTSQPKRIPGSVLRYCFEVENVGAIDANNTKIEDNLIGSGRDNLTYKSSGYVVQSSSTPCECKNITDTSGTISGRSVTIDIGDIDSTQKACAYIEVELK